MQQHDTFGEMTKPTNCAKYFMIEQPTNCSAFPFCPSSSNMATQREQAAPLPTRTGSCSKQWLIQRPVHQSFGLVKCTVGLVGLVKKWGI